MLFYFFKRKINEILLSALFDLKLYTSCFFSRHQDIITELSNTNLILAWYTEGFEIHTNVLNPTK